MVGPGVSTAGIASEPEPDSESATGVRDRPLREDLEPVIGVLGLQGDVREHAEALERSGARARIVLRPDDLRDLDGIVLPGGESTTIGQLLVDFGLLAPLRAAIAGGLPAWGTCAGLILLARDVGRDQPLIGGLDVSVDRNAFGRQTDSFETDVVVDGIEGGPFRAVFIRAPAVTYAGPSVEILARLDDGTIVAVAQGHLVGTAFHPELTGDDRLHARFVRLVGGRRGTILSSQP